MATLLEQIVQLSVQGKLDFVSALWESMARHPETIPVPGWQIKVLEQRIEEQQKESEAWRIMGSDEARNSSCPQSMNQPIVT